APGGAPGRSPKRLSASDRANRDFGPRTQPSLPALSQRPHRLRCLPRRRATIALDLAPTRNHFPIAAPGFWADDREHGEGTSLPGRHSVAADGGNLAPPPGIDYRSPKPKPESVNHFSENLVSKLNRPHSPAFMLQCIRMDQLGSKQLSRRRRTKKTTTFFSVSVTAILC